MFDPHLARARARAPTTSQTPVCGGSNLCARFAGAPYSRLFSCLSFSYSGLVHAINSRASAPRASTLHAPRPAFALAPPAWQGKWREAPAAELAKRKMVKVRRKGAVVPENAAPAPAAAAAADTAAAPAAAASAPAPRMTFAQLAAAQSASGMWECTACMLSNKADAESCISCSFWKCPKCKHCSHPEKSAAACEKCKAPRAQKAEPAKAAAAAAKPAFTFGAAAASAAPASGGAAKPAFTFGAAAAGGDAPKFTFGGVAAAAKTASGSGDGKPAFTFGAKAVGADGEKKPSVFDTATSKPFGFGATASAASASGAGEAGSGGGAASGAAGEGSGSATAFKGTGPQEKGDENDKTLVKVPAVKAYQLKTIEAPAPAEGDAAAAAAGEKKTKWAEMGEGELHFNEATAEGDKPAFRLLLRADKTQRLVLNTRLFKGMAHNVQGDRYVRFVAPNAEGKITVYLMKFKLKSDASEVDAALTKALEKV